MTPSQAIVAATKNGALACRMQKDLGHDRNGQARRPRSLLDADPLADISNIRKLRTVFKEGRADRPEHASDQSDLVQAAADDVDVAGRPVGGARIRPLAVGVVLLFAFTAAGAACRPQLIATSFERSHAGGTGDEDRSESERRRRGGSRGSDGRSTSARYRGRRECPVPGWRVDAHNCSARPTLGGRVAGHPRSTRSSDPGIRAESCQSPVATRTLHRVRAT